MSDIDFQNGFICGMATKGLTRSGELYEPNCYNDSGVYTYFYIDFRHAMEDFSVGMFNESIIVFDSVQLTVTQIDFVSTGLYKIWCTDLSPRIHGVTVLNKITSRLKYATGGKLPAFSTHFWVAGVDVYNDICYVYDKAPNIVSFGEVTESSSFTLT